MEARDFYQVFRLGTDTILAKTVFLSLFAQIGKSVTTINITVGKIGPTCCITSTTALPHALNQLDRNN